MFLNARTIFSNLQSPACKKGKTEILNFFRDLLLQKLGYRHLLRDIQIMTPAQCRAARALLAITQQRLADMADVSLTHHYRF
jgi:hypothetical protein